MLRRDINIFLDQLGKWVVHEPFIKAIALVGSYARGDAHEGSDIDLVMLCEHNECYVQDEGWIHHFGPYTNVVLEDWGAVQSVRVHFHDCEVEFSFGHLSWACTEPVDSGTFEVISNGVKVVYDPDLMMTALLQAAGIY